MGCELTEYVKLVHTCFTYCIINDNSLGPRYLTLKAYMFFSYQ